ncbi:RNA-directed DNA polymerase from mobile element jockey [Orchesella cincta]|uniref:RNA-directed DNA polymerase from mobile element jockey n=1 Tax=Orchesella cincta TaxID=48709 RepID=A0A1D2MAZ3_ORCCI|nr:RNA-directed DNA polymerase from mobile element jockey [Orchesella cincta]
MHNIDDDTWKQYYNKIQPHRVIDNLQYFSVLHPSLDGIFTIKELQLGLKRLSSNKASGPDQIKNEHLKYLPPIAQQCLLNTVNMIWENENPPEEWSVSETVMIQKKGDVKEPGNYRPIALLNTQMKLFTSMVQNRLLEWVERAKILPEAQAGFRKGRSCVDQIFTLNAILQIGTKRTRVNGKTKRILRKIYERASTKVRTKTGQSSNIDITAGVLQGETISPLLFSLFISDIEERFEEWNIPGIRIGPKEIHTLLFADDTIVLSHSSTTIQQKIDKLSDYFMELGLNVNTSKTKVMIFRRRQRIKSQKFYYRGEELEIVDRYTYLGVTFGKNILYKETAKEFKKKGGKCAGLLQKPRFYGLPSPTPSSKNQGEFQQITNQKKVLTALTNLSCFTTINNFRDVDIFPPTTPVHLRTPELSEIMKCNTTDLLWDDFYQQPIPSSFCLQLSLFEYSAKLRPWQCQIEISLYPPNLYKYGYNFPDPFRRNNGNSYFSSFIYYRTPMLKMFVGDDKIQFINSDLLEKWVNHARSFNYPERYLPTNLVFLLARVISTSSNVRNSHVGEIHAIEAIKICQDCYNKYFTNESMPLAGVYLQAVPMISSLEKLSEFCSSKPKKERYWGVVPI